MQNMREHTPKTTRRSVNERDSASPQLLPNYSFELSRRSSTSHTLNLFCAGARQNLNFAWDFLRKTQFSWNFKIFSIFLIFLKFLVCPGSYRMRSPKKIEKNKPFVSQIITDSSYFLFLKSRKTCRTLDAGGKPSTWFPPEWLVELPRAFLKHYYLFILLYFTF